PSWAIVMPCWPASLPDSAHFRSMTGWMVEICAGMRARPNRPVRNLGPRTGLSKTTSSATKSSTSSCTCGLATWPGCYCPAGPSICGRLLERRQLPGGLERLRAVFFAGDHLGEGTPRAHSEGLHGQSRVVLLRLARRSGASILWADQCRGRLVGEEDQPAE